MIKTQLSRHQKSNCVGILEAIKLIRGLNFLHSYWKQLGIVSVEQREACVLRAAHKLGYAEVRKHQAEAVMKFMQGDDVFVSLPTGSGKSLIYSVLPVKGVHPVM